MSDKIEKYYNEDGKVGVLVSGGHGAGWSTWNSDEHNGAFLCMDKTLVDMVLKKDYNEEFLENYLGEDTYLGGFYACEVEFLGKGTAFRIEEYDGSESLVILSEDNIIVT